MKISVIGTGRWASTNIWIAVNGGHTVKCWDRFETDFMKTKKNRYVDLSNSKDVVCCKSLKETLNYGEIVIISILSQELDNLMKDIEKIPGYEKKKYCIAMKGVEATTGRTLSEIMIAHGVDKNNIAVLAGPGQPESIVENKKYNKMLVAAYDSELARNICKIIRTDKFSLVCWPDVQGCEYCAAAKNVYSALGGMCEGEGQQTLKGAIMSVSIYEMQNYLEAMECNPETAIHLSLLADYNATLYDPVSHNLNYGIEVVKQKTANPVLNFNSVEGKYAVKGLLKRLIIRNAQLAEEKKVQAALLNVFNDIVDEKIPATEAVESINDSLENSLNSWANEEYNKLTFNNSFENSFNSNEDYMNQY